MINNYILNHNNIMNKIKIKNLTLILPLLILNTISLLNMVNAKYISETYNNAFYKQLLWFILGYILIFIFQKLKIKKVFNYGKYLYFFSCLLLFIVLFLGNEINGAKCWLNIFGISFQPSEITKLALIIYAIEIIDETKAKKLKDEFKLILKLVIITLIPSILVFLEPDTGAIISYVIILFTILLTIKLNKLWYIIGFSFSFILLLIIFILFFYYQDFFIKIIGTSIFYRMDRIINFANGVSYQLENSLITLGVASFFGTGLNNIIIYIPEAPTDFIFSFSTGNFGIFSSILILINFFIIDIYLIIKNDKNQDKKLKIFINSFLSIFIFHQIYNILMNIGLLPIMGIPLPFLSYGGTTTLINFLFLAIILNLINIKTIK